MKQVYEMQMYYSGGIGFYLVRQWQPLSVFLVDRDCWLVYVGWEEGRHIYTGCQETFRNQRD